MSHELLIDRIVHVACLTLNLLKMEQMKVSVFQQDLVASGAASCRPSKVHEYTSVLGVSKFGTVNLEFVTCRNLPTGYMVL